MDLSDLEEIMMTISQRRLQLASETKPRLVTGCLPQSSNSNQEHRLSMQSTLGHKGKGALEVFKDVKVDGKNCLDAGASTGGATRFRRARL